MKLFRLRFRRPTIVACGCAAFLLGIGAAENARFLVPYWLLIFGFFGVWRVRKQHVFVLLALMFVCFCVGNWRGGLYAQKVALYDGLFKQKAVFIGRAQVDAVYGKSGQLAFTADNLQVVAPKQALLVGRITVSGFGAAAIFRGDTVQMSGTLYPTLGGNQAKLNFATLRVLHHHTSWIDMVRQKFVAGVQSALPEPVASFGLGLLIGQRNTLPDDISKQLTMVGLTHIIAVSGYNLTIILQVVRKLVGKRSKFQSLVFFVALIGVFVLLVGSSPSIVRAAIVSLLSIAAWYYGRTFKPLTLLLLAAAITAYANPLYVWGNVSWYLSFLAFAGVMMLAPLVVKRFFVREPGLLVMVLLESLCAEIMTLPYVLYIFGQMSLVSLIANVLVVSLVPLAMLLTLIAGLAGMFAAAFAGRVAWPARYLLTYMLEVTRLLSRTPHAFIEHIGFPLIDLFLAYGAAGIFGLSIRRRAKHAIITDKKAEAREGV